MHMKNKIEILFFFFALLRIVLFRFNLNATLVLFEVNECMLGILRI